MHSIMIPVNTSILKETASVLIVVNTSITGMTVSIAARKKRKKNVGAKAVEFGTKIDHRKGMLQHDKRFVLLSALL